MLEEGFQHQDLGHKKSTQQHHETVGRQIGPTVGTRRRRDGGSRPAEQPLDLAWGCSLFMGQTTGASRDKVTGTQAPWVEGVLPRKKNLTRVVISPGDTVGGHSIEHQWAGSRRSSGPKAKNRGDEPPALQWTNLGRSHPVVPTENL